MPTDRAPAAGQPVRILSRSSEEQIPKMPFLLPKLPSMNPFSPANLTQHQYLLHSHLYELGPIDPQVRLL